MARFQWGQNVNILMQCQCTLKNHRRLKLIWYPHSFMVHVQLCDVQSICQITFIFTESIHYYTNMQLWIDSAAHKAIRTTGFMYPGILRTLCGMVVLLRSSWNCSFQLHALFNFTLSLLHHRLSDIYVRCLQPAAKYSSQRSWTTYTV